jgi:hypothetical protein
VLNAGLSANPSLIKWPLPFEGFTEARSLWWQLEHKHTDAHAHALTHTHTSAKLHQESLPNQLLDENICNISTLELLKQLQTNLACILALVKGRSQAI